MSFQQVLSSDEAWEQDVLQTPGTMHVIDVHQAWCGPCKAIASTFKRVFLDFGDKARNVA